jgi:cytochrome c oxidase subunit IV
MTIEEQISTNIHEQLLKQRTFFQRMLKYKILYKAFIVAIVVLILKFFTDRYNLSQIAINTLTSSFFAGVFFTISILFTAAMTDFKEAEKIPGELAVILKALHNDAGMASATEAGVADSEDIVYHVEELLFVISANFRGNHWHKKELDAQINLIDRDIDDLWRKNSPVQLLLKLRDNLVIIDRLSHRIDYIGYSQDIRGAYIISDLALMSVFLMFVFVQNEWGFGGLLLLSAIVFIMSSIMLLIHDMDNPFEYEMNSLAAVDMSVIFKLEQMWKNGRIGIIS